MKREEELDAVITSLRAAVLQRLRLSNLSAPTSSPGIQLDCLIKQLRESDRFKEDIERSAQELIVRLELNLPASTSSRRRVQPDFLIKQALIKSDRFKEDIERSAQELIAQAYLYRSIHFQESERSRKELERHLEEVNANLEILEKESKLQKRLRKYKKSDPAETWATRWVASPIAYLFPEERREEWLGDLYELNREMIHKGYGRWLVNLINVGRTVILVLSALQIKLSDFISIGKAKSD